MFICFADTVRNVTFEPHYDNYFNGDQIECKAKGNPTPTIEWEIIESPGGMENVDGAVLTISPSMVGTNHWACNVENMVEGNVTYIREEIAFEVCK